ncbi:hypothetical protein K503DRAFT_781537 [Rhizopogon vinicolor AM-OR11-026]|uniref:Uncharacterized protein n=1 Tax=Rhizopogon vinicolor AM-OR11-026 TaxID=1314800 RepID=A0A1B7N654_9AGAM|nr:hypothetical protein K503DRAFT_781537 [Rhizopogon vinicolor AM-OR11-026]
MLHSTAVVRLALPYPKVTLSLNSFSGETQRDEGPIHLVEAEFIKQLEDFGCCKYTGCIPHEEENPSVKAHVTLGGDHSLAMGTISGTLRAYDHATNESRTSVPSVGVGVRDVEKGEEEILKKYNIKVFGMHEVDRVVEMAFNHVNPPRDRPIHLNFNVDALDLSVAPRTETLRQCQCIPTTFNFKVKSSTPLTRSTNKDTVCKVIHEIGLLVALNLMEVNPALADAESSPTFPLGSCIWPLSSNGNSVGGTLLDVHSDDQQRGMRDPSLNFIKRIAIFD